MPIPAGPTNRIGDHATAVAHGMQGEVVVQYLGQLSEVGKSRLEVFDQLRPVIGQLTQLAAFVASGPDALGDVLRPLGLLIGLCAVALDKLRKPAASETRFGCCPMVACGAADRRCCRWLHVGQRLHQRMYGIVDGRIERLAAPTSRAWWRPAVTLPLRASL